MNCLFCAHASSRPQPAFEKKYPRFFKDRAELENYLLGGAVRNLYFNLKESSPRIFCHAFEDRNDCGAGRGIDISFHCPRFEKATVEAVRKRAEFYRRSPTYHKHHMDYMIFNYTD